jgi:hypothetical protein
VPVLAVVMPAGVDARFVTVNVNGPPADPSVVFCNVTVAAFTFKVLVIVQVICAAATTLAGGTVSTLPMSAPKLAGFPVTAELASVQLAAVAVKFVAGVSVKVTAVLKAGTVLATGAAGVAVLAVVVVMAAGAAAKLATANVKGPPIAPTVIFFNATVAGFAVFVKLHAMESP